MDSLVVQLHGPQSPLLNRPDTLFKSSIELVQRSFGIFTYSHVQLCGQSVNLGEDLRRVYLQVMAFIIGSKTKLQNLKYYLNVFY